MATVTSTQVAFKPMPMEARHDWVTIVDTKSGGVEILSKNVVVVPVDVTVVNWVSVGVPTQAIS